MEEVRAFSEKVLEKFKEAVKAIVLFGSRARGEEREKSDIDVMIIFDDTILPWTNEVVRYLFEEIGKILKEMKCDKIHANVISLSYFFEGIFKSDPIIVNLIRDGEAIFDEGIFRTMKRLVLSGRIKALPITHYISYQRSLMAEGAAKFKLLAILVDIYWAMILAVESFLLKNNVVPEDPERVIERAKDFLDEKYINWLKEIYEIFKKIVRREKNEATPDEVKIWFERLKELREVLSKF